MGYECGKFTASGQQFHCCKNPGTTVTSKSQCAVMPKELTRSGFDDPEQCRNQCQAITQYEGPNKITEFECKGKVRNDARWFLLFLLLRIRTSIRSLFKPWTIDTCWVYSRQRFFIIMYVFNSTT